jgi:hypothetical protein
MVNRGLVVWVWSPEFSLGFVASQKQCYMIFRVLQKRASMVCAPEGRAEQRHLAGHDTVGVRAGLARPAVERATPGRG